MDFKRYLRMELLQSHFFVSSLQFAARWSSRFGTVYSACIILLRAPYGTWYWISPLDLTRKCHLKIKI